MRTSPGDGDKSVLFRMPSADMAVFFNRELVPLWEVLAEGCPEGTGLLGHDVTVDEKGRLDVTPTEGGDKVRHTEAHALTGRSARGTP